MKTEEAVSVLKNLAFKPGWRFDAMAFTDLPAADRFMAMVQRGSYYSDTTVFFHLTTETVDTDREYAMEGYDMPKTLEDTIPLDAADFKDADELLYAVLMLLMRLELHEAREFFRCKDRDWNAPFHPHKAEGNELWAKCSEAN